jgi:hypothetical protein
VNDPAQHVRTCRVGAKWVLATRWSEARAKVDGARIVRGEHRGEYRGYEDYG